MIIGPRNDWAFVAIPRNASRSMVDFLKNCKGHQYGQHHSWQYPRQDNLPLTRIVIVRNPYRRIISFCNLLIDDSNTASWGPKGNRTLSSLLKRIITQCKESAPMHRVPEWVWNQTNYSKLAQATHIIRFEELVKNPRDTLGEIEALKPYLSTKYPFPHVSEGKPHSSYLPTGPDEMTAEELELVLEYCLEDFTTLDYPIWEPKR